MAIEPHFTWFTWYNMLVHFLIKKNLAKASEEKVQNDTLTEPIGGQVILIKNAYGNL